MTADLDADADAGAPAALLPAGPAGPAALPYPGCPMPEPAGEPDWALVARLRRAVHDQLSALLAARPGLEPASQRELARQLIAEHVTGWVDTQAATGLPLPTPAEEQVLAGAVFASIYGLGRLEALLADPLVEDVEIAGADVVWVHYADGRRLPGPPVAGSDTELVELLQSWAAYHGQSAREFSTARPLLNLRLPDGSRLAAVIALTPRPQIAIRRHRLVDVTLTDLVDLGTIDEVLAGFLRAAVHARLNMVITGVMGAGKTTLLRALANELPAGERIGTLEKEFELGLHTLPRRHLPGRVVAVEARDANADGGGAIGLADLVPQMLRMNLRRLIVGEVRSDEIIPMLDAMSSGGDGSLCTVHVKRGVSPISRLVALAMRGPDRMGEGVAHQLIADGLDLIVHIHLTDTPTHSAAGQVGQRRTVSHIHEITGIGEGGRIATNTLFHPGPGGRGVPATPPACLPALVNAGFNPALLDYPAGLWTQPDQPAQPPARAAAGAVGGRW